MSCYSLVISSANKRLPRVLLKHRGLLASRPYSSQDDQDGDDKSPPKLDLRKRSKEQDAKTSLSSLLNKVKHDKKPISEVQPLELKAKPVKKIVRRRREDSSSSSSSSDDESEPLDRDLKVIAKKAAAEKAKHVKGDSDAKFAAEAAAESVLLKKLKSISSETEQSRKESQVAGSSDSMSSLFSSMKVSKETKRAPLQQEGRGMSKLTPEQEEFLEKRRALRRQSRMNQLSADYVPMDLFKAEPPIAVFNRPAAKPSKLLHTWPSILDRETKILLSSHPRNLIEDMVDMTDKGIMWHFPIDNEQGLKKEEMDSFIDHVFLEKHLEEWCPQSGPVREFMEVVCTTLSKNAFMTAAKKRDYIFWFRDYFNQPEQKDILKASGALDN